MKKWLALMSCLAVLAAPITVYAALEPEAPAGHGSHSHGASAEEEEPAEFKWFDTQILNNKQPPYLAVLFNFAVLVFIYYRFGRAPVAQALKDRRKTIGKEIEAAEEMLQEAKDRARRYRAKLDKVEDDAAEGKQVLIGAGKGESETILKNAEEKAARLKRDTEFLLEQEGKQLKIDLLRETVEKATTEAEQLLKKNVTPGDHERLAEAFLDQLARDYEKGLPVGGAS